VGHPVVASTRKDFARFERALLRKEAFSGILSFLILTIYHLDAILEERYL